MPRRFAIALRSQSRFAGGPPRSRAALGNTIAVKLERSDSQPKVACGAATEVARNPGNLLDPRKSHSASDTARIVEDNGRRQCKSSLIKVNQTKKCAQTRTPRLPALLLPSSLPACAVRAKQSAPREVVRSTLLPPHPSPFMMFLPFRRSLVTLLATALTPFAFAGVELKQEADKVRVEFDGHLFTEYHFSGARRPYLYPIIGPTGGAMTRHWPLDNDMPGEAQDHPHHKGLWFGHRNVNGAEFWGDDVKPGGNFGQIVHEALDVQNGDDVGVLRAKNKWVLDEGGELVCRDERTIRFHKGKDGPMIDFEITIIAPDKDVVFGDDKDGTMAIRVPESMRVEKVKQKGEKTAAPGEGHIVTSEGAHDKPAWGTRGEWCDYSGPVEGKTAGIAIFDHPQNPRHPTWWHVREYGLFAANPFGKAMFENLPNKEAGAYTIRKGQSATFRYRFYFHAGDAEQAKIPEHFREYVANVK